MNTFDAIESRRAIKHFDPDHRMTPEEETRLLEAAMLSPTAFNLQHWRFVVIRDPDLRQKIREAAWDQSQVTDASLLIVMTAKLSAWEEPAQYWQGAPDEVRDFMVSAIDEYYRGKPQVQRDEAMRTSGIASQTLMLAAKAMGYESCPMDGFDFDQVAKLINLPDDHVISNFVAIGKGTKDAWPRPGQLSRDTVVIENGF